MNHFFFYIFKVVLDRQYRDMSFKLWTAQGFYLSLLLVKVCCSEFKVTVPSSLVVTLGQPVVLPCSFSVGNVWQPESIVITWQRGLEVVHSFYYNRDQLKRQSPHYVKRTSLYQSEMQKGNASLRLENVTIEDRGEYICSVSSQLGSERKSFPLKVAALYSEPVLQFSVQPGSVTVLLTSGGGFPAPTLSWLQDHEDLTNSTETRLTRDTLSGLYNVYSTLTLKDNTIATLSFILRNEDLMEEIRRNISLPESEGDLPKASQRMRELILLPVLLVFILLAVLGLLLLQTICKPNRTKGILSTTEHCFSHVDIT
ncbi:butyrophilin-like protein 8 isoform X2 [Clupea harengus]|uniref:Butyrophilin-like protein 8 isoform X2 n=1 Tax=Clupea harengus TaxID=7950 RepID=A0A6P8GME4_CLUHA|nr:butyrophilin-like protein 8 isoform X2 [Clupea harengus]XP_031436632.2 butyrophilin-like protein 8 isoform X2 [Clupea harengus]